MKDDLIKKFIIKLSKEGIDAVDIPLKLVQSEQKLKDFMEKNLKSFDNIILIKERKLENMAT